MVEDKIEEVRCSINKLFVDLFDCSTVTTKKDAVDLDF